MDSNRQSIVIGTAALVLIALVIVGGYFVINRDAAYKSLPVDTAYAVPDSVAIQHTVKNGVHTFSGTVPMTSTCNKVIAGVSYDKKKTVIEAAVSVVVLSASDGHCQGVANGATQSFSTDFTPPSALPVKVTAFTVNGKAVRFTAN